jgi:subtilase family serine protease
MKNFKRIKITINYFILFVLSFIFILPCTRLYANGRQQLHGHVPKEVKTAPLLGDLPSDQRLRISVGLPFRDKNAVDVEIKSLYDKDSPNYKKFLTTDEIASRFGPSQDDYQKVIDFFQSRGFVIKNVYKSRSLITVEGSVDDIQKTLNIHLHNYRRSDGKTFYAPDTEPSLDLDVPLLFISGLDTHVIHQLPHHHKDMPKNGSGSAPCVSGDCNAFIGFDFRNAYCPGIRFDGFGQNVALLQFDGFNMPDIRTYEQTAGIASNPTVATTIIGGTGSVGTGNNEVCLDIEMVISMAPEATVQVYEGIGGVDDAAILQQIADDYTTSKSAKQISCSWSLSTDPNISVACDDFAMNGQTFFNATGDYGAFVAGDTEPLPDSPEILTDEVTDVGGTELTTFSPGGSWSSETTWDEPSIC